MQAYAAEIAALIDHALLTPTLTRASIEDDCRMARTFGVASVCVMPCHLARCAGILTGSQVRPSTTIGFPHGVQTTAVKVAEARQALADGGVELDMVVNASWVQSGDWDAVSDDLRAVIDTTHAGGAKLKVIFETAALSQAQIATLCELCNGLRPDWVKTSTGFGPGGATLACVAQLRRLTDPDIGVKASGGIRDLPTLLAMRAAGADRIGLSRTREILSAAINPPDRVPDR